MEFINCTFKLQAVPERLVPFSIIHICDMIKGNESLVENFNFYFLTPLSHHLKMLHFDANPLQLDIWLQSYEGFDNAKNNMKQKHLNTVFVNISKTASPTHSS